MVRAKKNRKRRVLLFLFLFSFRLSHFTGSVCIRKKKHIRSHYIAVYKRDNQVMKEKEKYISHIDDAIYQAFFVFFHALSLLLFTDDIGDGFKMMRHIHHPSSMRQNRC